MEEAMILSDIIKETRIKLDMTQHKLASMMGVKPQLICYLEKEKRNPSLLTLAKVLAGINKLTGTSYTYKDFE
jgi:DNA-binding XRE family transcriptional regulator